MKVSIIIPVYNVESYLEECLNSAINQTLKEIEIICVNDGSTDSSLEILNKYKEKNYNLKIINQENKGISAARNEGIKVAQGKYVYFLDSDDYITLDAMKICYNEAEKNDLDILTFDAKCFMDPNYTGNTIDENYNRCDILDTNIYCGNEFYLISNNKGAYRSPVWLYFYNRKFIIENSLYFIEGIVHEDEVYTVNSLLLAKSIKYIPKKLFNRRFRDNSIMTSKLNKKRLYGNLAIANEVYKLYTNNKLDNEIKQILLEWIRVYYSNCLRISHALNLWDVRNEIIEDINNKKDVMDINLEIKINKFNLFLDINNIKFDRTNELYLYKNKKKIFYMMLPEHGNLGDHAIVYSTLLFLKEYYKEYNIIKIDHKDTYLYTDIIKKIYNKGDFLVLVGGGNMGNHYLWEEKARRHIISTMTNIPIISFPQTIYFSDDKEGRKEFSITKKIYNNHNNLILLAREEKSFNIMKKNFNNCKVSLCPDIVFYLNNKLEIEKEHLDRKYITTFFRKDKESYYSINDKNKLIKSIKNKYSFLESDTVINYKVNGLNRQKELFDVWRQFYKSKLVITDRLHGMIFAAITKTPCIVLRSFDYKVIKSYKWIDSLNYIRMIDNIDLKKVENIINELESIDEKDSFCFDKIYLENIKKCIDKSLELIL